MALVAGASRAAWSLCAAWRRKFLWRWKASLKCFARMSITSKKRAKRHTTRADASERKFFKRLNDLNAGLARLEASLRKREKPKRRKPGRARSRPGAAKAQSAAPAESAKPVAKSRAAADGPKADVQKAAAAAPPEPLSSDLSHPKNFSLLPLAADLEQGAAHEADYRQRLSRSLEFAIRVLHTSGIPAAIWREWRQFEKAAKKRLAAPAA